MNLIAINQIVKAEMTGKHSPPRYMERDTKYNHGQRVATLALHLRKLILPTESAYDEILTVAAWFHDVCHGEDNHWTVGAKRTRQLLANHCTPEELGQICDIIAVHDDRSKKTDYSDIIKIHQDADILDHLGTLEIWHRAAYGAAHNAMISENLHHFQNNRPEEAKKWHAEINYDICKPIFDDKLCFAASFMERLAVESVGEVY